MKRVPPLVKGSILVVEDEKIIAKDIANVLKKFGYAVPAIASSGEEAIRRLEEMPVDLVLMDIVLKGDIDGIEAAKRITERFNIPVVHLTAYADEDTLSRVKETRPFGYIIKPFKERELYTTIEIALHNHRQSLENRKLEEKRIEELRQKLQQLQQFTDVKGTLFKKFLQDLSEPLSNLSFALGLLKDAESEQKREHYLQVLEDEFRRELELIHQTSNLENLLNLENVGLLSQFSLLRPQEPSRSHRLEQEAPTPATTPSQESAGSAPAPSPTAATAPRAPLRPLNQTQLAERLGVVVSAITYWKFKTGFPEWSRSRDPEGISWRYSPDSKRFSPVP
ncbi:response regulator [Synechococcus sp. JA-2-3B'a(2-13)]|uniref:response regulator n=1 Tax=Synechococcus sp. (strain JA-2-3B'a(2-13)) TaxID=321332 RepID=UPI0000694F9D|nr:response regulator [Synechococcus sp. JA-2-3B'a(2-13)]ABD02613.1 response regulator [Synechococcus sp. JA-2-3B'a(2-13)]